MKLNLLTRHALAATVFAAGAVTNAGATYLCFSGPEQDFYVESKATGEKYQFDNLQWGCQVLNLEPGTYYIHGYHQNDRNETPLYASFEVLPEENYTREEDEDLGPIDEWVTLGYGYYRVDQPYYDADNVYHSSYYGGEDFTVSDVTLCDKAGNPVEYNYAWCQGDNDTAPSGYYIIGIYGYKTTATFTPNSEKFPLLLPTNLETSLSYNSNITRVTFNEATLLTFNYPSDANGNMYYKKDETHYIPFVLIEPDEVSETDGITTKKYKVAKNSQDYNYRVSREGDITCAGIFQSNRVQEVTVTDEQLNAYSPHYFKHDVSTKVGNGTQYSDIFLNINKRHLLRMQRDEEYQIVNLRTWQLTNNSTGNYFIEPDYHWTVLNTNFEPDQSVVTVDKNGVLKALAPGIAIVQVGYDAIRLSAMDSDIWSELWAENMGTFVVTVDADESAAPADNIHLAYKPEYDLDAEHDILYYMSDTPGYELTFTPAEGATITVANPLVNTEENSVTYPDGFSDKNVTLNEDGSVTALLTYGRNIIRTTGADGNTNYQVLSAKPITCEVETPRADGLALPGDQIKFKFDGLFHVAGKLAGIYNSNCHIRFNDISTLAGTVLGNGQYDFAGNQAAQTFTVTVPMDATDKVEITKGCLDPEGYGSGPGAHRAVDYVLGMKPNFSAGVSSGEYGSIPSQSYTVTPFNQVDRLSIKTKMGKSVIPVRMSVLKEVYGDNIHWEIEDETLAVVNDSWAICPAKPGTTVAYLYADEAALDDEGERSPLLTCDVEIEDVEGYIPVESIAFKHEGDLEFKMNLSWGNWGNQCYLSTVVLPENATDKTVHLTSLNPDMVTLGKKGNAEYDSNYCGLFWNLNNLPGESEVVAESADGRLKISTIVRFHRHSDSITFENEEYEATLGEPFQLEATVKPAQCDYPIEWSSDDEDIAIVDEEGYVTPLKEGTATIHAAVEGRYSPNTAQCLVTVKKSVTGVNEIESTVFSMYPNPCEETLNVVAAADGELYIYGLDGSLAFKTRVNTGGNMINVSTLSSGLYIVRLGDISSKLVKK